MKVIKMVIARIKCKLDKGEWTNHYCTGNCNSCGYNK